MKRHWCKETAGKAYIDTVKAMQPSSFPANAAELISAMAAGFEAQVIVEAWAPGDGMASSMALAIARGHTGGRHVCVVPDEWSQAEYVAAARRAGMEPEVLVGEMEEVMSSLPEVDFVLVDCRRKDFAKVLRFAKVGARGAVLVAKQAGPRGFRWRGVLPSRTRVVRSAFLPAAKGVEIVQVALGGDCAGSARSRWIKHVDHSTGEEHLFRRC